MIVQCPLWLVLIPQEPIPTQEKKYKCHFLAEANLNLVNHFANCLTNI